MRAHHSSRPDLGVLLLWALLGPACGDPELPEILVVRDFALTDQNGDPFHATELRGSVAIVSFLFTSCSSTCPMTTMRLVNLEHRLRDERNIRLVSITVDPAVDTPDRLRRYAAQYAQTDRKRWALLTGAPDEVRRVVVDVLRSEMGAPRRTARGYDVPHSGKLMLVDRRGVVRGEFDPVEELHELERFARELAAAR